MVEPKVTVEGLDLLNQNLQRVRTGYPPEMKKIEQKTIQPVVKLAARNIRTRSGRLASSGRMVPSREGASVQFGGTSVPYAAVNHWGGYPGAYRGNPYLTDALADTEDKIVKVWDSLTHTWLEKVWRDS